MWLVSQFLRQITSKMVNDLRLWLTREQAQQLLEQARSDAPHETCGIIGGRDGRAEQIIPLPNVATDPLHNFYAEPTALARALTRLTAEKTDVLAIYHSHPFTEPIPSASDIQQAGYPNAVQLIISLRDSQPAFAAWQIHGGQVDRADLHIGDSTAAQTSETLSTAQKTAILIAAALAFAVMLVLSIYLLPPAPEIPVP